MILEAGMQGGQLHVPAALPPGESPGTQCAGDREGPTAGLDGRWEDKISCTHEVSNPEP
jgi:hypothetical protein